MGGGLHPVQVEAVAWVAGLRDLLGGAFSLAVITLFLAFLAEHQGRGRRIFYYLSGTLLLLLAFGSKPASVVTPALALITGLWLIQGHRPLWNSLMDSGALYWTWLIPAGLLAILIAIKKLRCYLLPYGILLIGVLPTLGLIPFNFQIVSTVSDRYLYLAMLGPALALGMVMARVSFPRALVISLILLPGWAVLTLLQLPEWADGKTFFQATLAMNPTSW